MVIDSTIDSCQSYQRRKWQPKKRTSCGDLQKFRQFWICTGAPS